MKRIAEFMESGLDVEMVEQLGYERYDVQGKETDDSRNGHSKKTLRTSFGDTTIQVPRDRKGEFDPVILRKNQTSISQDVEAKIMFLVRETGLEAIIGCLYRAKMFKTVSI